MNMPGFTAVALLSRKPVRYQSTGRASATGFRGGVVPALPIGEGPTVSKEDLQIQGYTCGVVSLGFWECTKPGSQTYWCDASSCQPKPLRTQLGVMLPIVHRPIGGFFHTLET
jgi:hypothetical protein